MKAIDSFQLLWFELSQLPNLSWLGWVGGRIGGGATLRHSMSTPYIVERANKIDSEGMTLLLIMY